MLLLMPNIFVDPPNVMVVGLLIMLSFTSAGLVEVNKHPEAVVVSRSKMRY